MRITMIRHLPTGWNQKTWLQGRRDIELSPLKEEDWKEIAANKRILKKQEPFDLVLASTLKRTHQTANLYGYHAETECLLDELDFGPFEGFPKAALLEKYGHQWINDPKELVLGESITNLEVRIRLFLDKYKEYANLLAFGHGSWMRAMLSYLQSGHVNHMNTFTIDNNCCLTRTFYPALTVSRLPTQDFNQFEEV